MADKIEIDVIARTDQVGPKLRQVRAELASFVKDAKSAGTAGVNTAALDQLKQHIFQLTQRPAAVQRGLADATSGTDKFRESLHVLHPLLESAGVGFGNIRLLSALAGAGFEAFGVAIAGSLLIKLARLGDQSKRTAADLQGLYGVGEGSEVKDRLTARAKGLGVSVESLAAPEAELREARELRGVTPEEEKQQTRHIGDASAALEKVSQFYARAPGEGLKAAQDLFGSFAAQGREHPGQPQFLTPEAALSLLKTNPGVGNELAKSLGFQKGAGDLAAQIGAPGGPHVSLDDLLGAISRIGANQRFDKVPVERQTTGSEASKAGEALKASAEAPIGKAISDFVLQLMKEMRLELERSPESLGAKAQAQIVAQAQGTDVATPEKPAGLALLDYLQGKVAAAPPPAPGIGQQAVAAAPALEEIDALGGSARSAADALDQTARSAQASRKAQDEQAAALKQSGREETTRGLGLSKEAARQALEFEPEETASKLAHDSLGIESAGENAEGVQINLAQAEHNLQTLKPHQIGTERYQTGLHSFEDTPIIDSVQSALDRQKAQLDVERAQTAARSAAQEQSDANLRFRVDTAGAPVSHELQQLRYDEAQTKELENIAANTGRTASGVAAIASELGGKGGSGKGDNAGGSNVGGQAEGGPVGAAGILPTVSGFADGGPVDAPGFAAGGLIGDFQGGPGPNYGVEQSQGSVFTGVAPGSVAAVNDGSPGLTPDQQAALAWPESASAIAEKASLSGETLSSSFFGRVAGPGTFVGNPKFAYADGGALLRLAHLAAGGRPVSVDRGVISGPGTGTSDSILARVDEGGMIRVSNKEGIVSAKGMARIGIGGLAAINSFAGGGTINFGGFSAPNAPAIGSFTSNSSGGGVSGRPVEIHVYSGRGDATVYQAVMANDIADQLASEAALYEMASGGRRSAAQQ